MIKQKPEKFRYKPSRFFLVAVFSFSVPILMSNNPVVFALCNCLIFVTLVFDVETQKKKNLRGDIDG